MKITGKLTMVKAKGKDGKEAGPYEMKVSDLKFWNDNPYFLRAGVDAHDFLLKLEEPVGTVSEATAKVNDERRKVLLEEGTVQDTPFEAEYTSSGTIDLKLLPKPKEESKEQQEAAAEVLVRTERTPDGQPPDTLPVDRKSPEFKAALTRVKSGKTNPEDKKEVKAKKTK